jgi:hypothetical protein
MKPALMKAVRLHNYHELRSRRADGAHCSGQGGAPHRTYPLEAVNDAMDDLDAGRLQGRGI